MALSQGRDRTIYNPILSCPTRFSIFSPISNMPIPGFLSSIADKAQNAIKDSSLSQHIPSSLTGAPRPSPNSPPTATDSGSTQKSHAFVQIQHQFRQLQQTYS